MGLLLMYNFLRIASVSLALAFVAVPLGSANSAVITVFSNDAAGWAAAAGSAQTENFNDATLLPGLTVTTNFGSVTGGVWSDRMSASQTTTWFFGSPTIAFGGNWDLSPGAPGTGIAFTVTFLNNTTQLVAVEVPNTFTGEFFGFVSDTPFKSVLETVGIQSCSTCVAETHNLDNLTFSTSATPAPVPLPAALPLFATGLGVLGLLGWRRKRAAHKTSP